MKKIVVIIGISLFLCGCAAIKQGIEDYKVGKSTELVNGEVSPSEQAQAIAAPIKDLPVPYAGPIGTAIGFIALQLFTLKRGERIRKTGSPAIAVNSPSVTTNMFIGIEQFIANTFAGAFTTIQGSGGLTGTVLQRAWKVALATIASGTTVGMANPQVGSFLTAHPVLDIAFIALSSGIAAMEKALSTVPTVINSTPTTGTSATTTVINV